MTRVQVVYATRHNGTAGIAERIAEVLERRGMSVELSNAKTSPDPSGCDAVVVGSGVYLGRWLDEGATYLQRNSAQLAERPVWLFSSGPVGVVPKDGDPIESALGPADGPGSGGRKQIAALAEVIKPRDHHVFSGSYDPTDPPRSFTERFVRLMPVARQTLPSADFRDWVEIEKWAHEIASALEPVAAPVG